MTVPNRAIQLLVIAGIAKDLKEVPAGPIFSAMLTKFPYMSANDFNELVAVLVDSKAVVRKGNLIKWSNNEVWNNAIDSFDKMAKEAK